MNPKPAKIGLSTALPIGILVVLLFAFLATSCSHNTVYKGGILETEYTVYKVEAPKNCWKQIKAKNADLAFWNDDLAAFILVNSTCDKYRDAPVATLANHLFIGIEKKEYLVQTEMEIDGRDAVYSIVKGKLDGAEVRVAAYTLVRNYCTYDLSYSAPDGSFDKGLRDFQKLARHFRVIRRK